MSHYRFTPEGLLLFCHIQPGASQNSFSGLHGDRLKIRIRGQACDGQANKALLAFIASAFDVPLSAVALTAGTTARQKTLLIIHPLTLPENCFIERG